MDNYAIAVAKPMMAPVYHGTVTLQPRRQSNVRIVSTEMTTPAASMNNHAAEPIKRLEDIDLIAEHLWYSGRLRDYLMFIMGINFGLRYSDLSKLRFGDIITESGIYREPIVVREKKTKKTRAIYVNEAVASAFEKYCGNRPIRLDDLIFAGQSPIKPITRQAIDHKFKLIINEELGIPVHVSTHFFRKTYAYHFIMNAPERNRAIECLQQAFGHSSPTITLQYAGITDDEIRSTVMRMNLGGSRYLTLDSEVVYSYEYDGVTCDVLELDNS